MSFEFFIAYRHLLSRRKQAFLTLITVITIVGVIVGVAVLIVVMSVMNGFEVDLRDKILGNRAHIIINHIEKKGIRNHEDIIKKIEEIDGVMGCAPYVLTEGIASSKYDTIGVVIRGVKPNEEERVSRIKENVKEGDFDFTIVKSDKEDLAGGVVIGVLLKDRLGVSLNDTITLTLPRQVWSPFQPIPAVDRNFRITGIFYTGLFEYDSNLVYVDREVLQEAIVQKGVVNGIEVKVADIFGVDEIAERLKERLGYPFLIQTWKETNRSLFYALRLEKTAMFIILILIIFVASMNIASSLIMTVIDKTRDIGILRSLGATRGSIGRIFILEGSIVGLFGTLLGAVIGIILSLVLRDYVRIGLPKDVYYIDRLPIVLSMGDIFLVCSASILISILATIYPSLRASRLDPVEAIRYE
ncbi:MAG: lipoprotein-releasing ABC transporter permease subunit [bacterium]